MNPNEKIPLSKRIKALGNSKQMEANQEQERMRQVEEEYEKRISSIGHKIITVLREEGVTVAEWNALDSLVAKMVNKKVDELEIDKLISLGENKSSSEEEQSEQGNNG